jgi:peptidoglycan/LPS O-acetylase OafA/YrhL
MRQRIRTLDGLRFLAATGVLWIHCWTLHGNPRWYIGKVDLAGLLAIGGNGVDLFFVISGFCMYYFYASKNDFSYHDFYRFLVKRWVRLSPAFYVATIIYILTAKFVYHQKIDSFNNFLHSIFYLNNIFRQYITAPHFWTLSVEWQFYFLIPILLIYQNRIGFKRIFYIIFGLVALAALAAIFLLSDHADGLTLTLLFHGAEFGCGVIAARLLTKNTSFFKNRLLWLVLFIITSYAGRILIAKPMLDQLADHYNLFKLLGFALMGIGFGGILYLSVTSVKWLDVILGNKFFKTMGRISYSFYLLHPLVYPVIAAYTIQFIPALKGIAAPVFTTLVSGVILYPISVLSYNLLEKPFLSIGNLTTK